MIINNKVLTKREKGSLQRIENAQKSTLLLKTFFEKGFTSLVALSAIVKHYYPELLDSEIINFWHFRNVNDSMINKMEYVLEQLKSE